MLKNYIKIAFRNLSKHKGYSFINISGLAIGITLCILILTYVKHELSFDSFHEAKDQIVRVNMVDEDGTIGVTPSMVAPSLELRAPEVEQWVRLYEPTRYSPIIVTVEQEKFQESSFLYADSSFFDVFSFKLLIGNPKTVLSKPRSLVLPVSTANKLFGTIDVLGKTVNAQIFNSLVEFEVTGIVEDAPSNSHFKFDYVGSLNTMSRWSQLNDSEIRSANFYTYLKLSDNASTSELQTKVDHFVEEVIKEQRDVSLSLLPLTDIYLNSNVEFDIAPMGDKRNIYGFAFLAFMVLLIATINYINLATARSTRRASEVGIRKALGAKRSQVIKQFFGESIILTLISVGLALVFVEIFKGTFFNLMGQNIDFNLFSDPTSWVLLIGVVIITSALAGSYPAFLLSSYQPVKVLKGLLGTNASDGAMRKGLVISQFAISTFLIISTVIIFQQTDFVMSKNLGFDKESVVVLPARDRQLAPKQDILKAEVLRQPGVVSATYMSNIPGKVFGGYDAEHTPGNDPIGTAAGAADKDLVGALGIELLAGDGFPQTDGYTLEQGYVYLINETLASKFGWSPEDAINQPFNVLGNRGGEIVGVMKDFNFASLHSEVEPLALFINPNMYNYLMVKIAPNSTTQTLSSLASVWDEIAPHRPFEFEFLDQQLNSLYQNEIRSRNLLSLFSAMAIFIACLGLIGLSSFLIERRSKEIGIRKVLGASITNIVGLLSTDFLKLVAAGFILGAPIAWFAMDKWLANFAFRIDIGIFAFVVCAVVGIIIALVTVSGQSIKAALANPVDSLKSE
ncbi:MAG: ABC transporter permease [Balneolaceae bacterium]